MVLSLNKTDNNVGLLALLYCSFHHATSRGLAREMLRQPWGVALTLSGRKLNTDLSGSVGLCLPVMPSHCPQNPLQAAPDLIYLERCILTNSPWGSAWLQAAVLPVTSASSPCDCNKQPTGCPNLQSTNGFKWWEWLQMAEDEFRLALRKTFLTVSWWETIKGCPEKVWIPHIFHMFKCSRPG